MAKEAAEMSEETEHMIERSAGKEPEGALCPADTKEMRAVVLTGFGGLNKLRVTRKAMPEPQEGEIKIRVKACGLNFLDLMVRQGNIDNPPKTPLVPGFECSGIVEALGSNTKGFEEMCLCCHGGFPGGIHSAGFECRSPCVCAELP